MDYIFDVGVQHKTHQLIDVFEDSHHFLFEPATIYHDIIESNYSCIKHTLVKAAVSSKSGVLFQHLISQDLRGNITHTHLKSTPDRIDIFKDMYVGVIKTDVITLDEFFSSFHFNNSTNILKIDVDGEDTNVMIGCQNTLNNVGLMIVECPTNKIPERVNLAYEYGFEIWDIVSPGYYYDQLSQVDIFFVNAKIKGPNIDFNPWRKSAGKVIWEKWVHLE